LRWTHGGDVMLQLDHLCLTQDRFHLRADWSVHKGEKIAIVGPSGAGKSTLLMGIAGFIAAQSGRVLWDGADLAAQAAGARPMTILFQDHNLFAHLTVADNLGLGLSPRLRLSADQRDQIASVLARVGLNGLGPRKPGDLSGGQQSRVALARALLRARPILLLDEPFSALGPAMRHQMLDLTTELAAGATVLMVTHDPRDAQRFADRVVFVNDGYAHPPLADLFSNPPPDLRAYLG
jgi:thiamine transport system ATP-binding protein